MKTIILITGILGVCLFGSCASSSYVQSQTKLGNNATGRHNQQMN